MFTNTQEMPPRKLKWSLEKLTFTLLQNPVYLKRIPTGHHPCMVKAVSHRPSRQSHKLKPQLKEVLSSTDPYIYTRVVHVAVPGSAISSAPQSPPLLPPAWRADTKGMGSFLQLGLESS